MWTWFYTWNFYTRLHLTKSKFANIFYLVNVVEIGIAENQKFCKTKHFWTKFYLKRKFKSYLTSRVNGIFRQAVVRLHDYVENALNSIGHERFLGLKMLFLNFFNL